MRALLPFLLLAATSAHADPEREDVTFGIDAGPGYSHHDGKDAVGLCPPSIQFGRFIDPQFAVVARWTCTGEGMGNDSGDKFALWYGALALHVQYWVEPRWFIGPLAGLGAEIRYGHNSDAKRGLAFGMRAGSDLAYTASGAWQFSLEVVYVRHGDDAWFDETTGVSLHLGWQLH